MQIYTYAHVIFPFRNVHTLFNKIASIRASNRAAHILFRVHIAAITQTCNQTLHVRACSALSLYTDSVVVWLLPENLLFLPVLSVLLVGWLLG
jgi:hypothetical protein